MTSSDEQQQQPPPSPSSITDWSSIIGKNVKTVDYQDVGKVVGSADNEDTIIISYESPHSSYNYRVPRQCVQGFNDPDVLLSIARAELADYEISDIQDYAAQLRNIRTEQKGGGEEETTVPVTVMHEEVIVEKRPVAEANASASENAPSMNTRTQIRVPLIHEVVKVKKEPYVKEEIVIKKKPRTETKTVSEFVTKEKVVTSNNKNTIAEAS